MKGNVLYSICVVKQKKNKDETGGVVLLLCTHKAHPVPADSHSEAQPGKQSRGYHNNSSPLEPDYMYCRFNLDLLANEKTLFTQTLGLKLNRISEGNKHWFFTKSWKIRTSFWGNWILKWHKSWVKSLHNTKTMPLNLSSLFFRTM